MDGQTDIGTDVPTNGRTDGLMDGWTYSGICIMRSCLLIARRRPATRSLSSPPLQSPSAAVHIAIIILTALFAFSKNLLRSSLHCSPNNLYGIRPATRIFYRGMEGGGAFRLEVDLAINVVIMIKQSDWDYRVNKIVKGVVTVSVIVDSRMWGSGYYPRNILKNIDVIWCVLLYS